MQFKQRQDPFVGHAGQGLQQNYGNIASTVDGRIRYHTLPQCLVQYLVAAACGNWFRCLAISIFLSDYEAKNISVTKPATFASLTMMRGRVQLLISGVRWVDLESSELAIATALLLVPPDPRRRGGRQKAD